MKFYLIFLLLILTKQQLFEVLEKETKPVKNNSISEEILLKKQVKNMKESNDKNQESQEISSLFENGGLDSGFNESNINEKSNHANEINKHSKVNEAIQDQISTTIETPSPTELHKQYKKLLKEIKILNIENSSLKKKVNNLINEKNREVISMLQKKEHIENKKAVELNYSKNKESLDVLNQTVNEISLKLAELSKRSLTPTTFHFKDLISNKLNTKLIKVSPSSFKINKDANINISDITIKPIDLMNLKSFVDSIKKACGTDFANCSFESKSAFEKDLEDKKSMISTLSKLKHDSYFAWNK